MSLFSFARKFLVIVLLSLVSYAAKADVCMPDDPDFDELTCTENGGSVGTPLNLGGGPRSPQGVPIDGGASMLLLAGAGYGLKRMRNRQINNK